jgi:hypothetical protein
MNRVSGQSWTRWLKWGDFLLVGLIGGVAVLMFFLLFLHGGQANVSAVLMHNGDELFRISGDKLAGAGETRVVVDGFHYKLAWQRGGIRFMEADCSDKVCVRTGWISRPDEIAVCVPARLILKIIGDASGWTETGGPDVIAR